MNTTIVRHDFWYDETFFKMHLDSKFLYVYLIEGPQHQYLNVFKFGMRFAISFTGLSQDSIEAGLNELETKGFIEKYQDYVCLLKDPTAKVGGPYGELNAKKELEKLPVDVREHFNLDAEGIIVVEEKPKKTPKKSGPAPETIKQIIAKQPEALRGALQDFVDDRIERKKAPTTRAVKGWINKLQSMYPNDYESQAKSLQQSIDRGWMGLFEVKMDKSESKFL